LVQEVEPAAEYEPAAQVAQVVPPTELEKVPAAHVVQATLPVFGAIVPALQELQTAELGKEAKVPREHATQAEEPSAE
jgi:hypothetical protein